MTIKLLACSVLLIIVGVLDLALVDTSKELPIWVSIGLVSILTSIGFYQVYRIVRFKTS